MAYGVTDEGFVVKTLADIKAEIEADFKAEYGDSIPLDGNSQNGVLIGIMSDRLAEMWALAQAVYASQSPDNANTVDAMENLAALTGTQREPPTPSTVTATLTGTPTTSVPSGTQFSVETTEALFESTEDATIAAADAWAGATAYAVGDRVTNSSNVYQCIDDGTSAGSGGPTTEDSDITDNTVHWQFLGSGTGVVDVECQSVETGAIPALAGTLNAIATPVAGLEAVTNLADAELGSGEESLSDLRARRESELRAQGKAAVDAVRADVLEVTDVTACSVFENVTDSTDGNGLPPHSIEVLALGGDDTEIAQAIWDSKAGGIATYGSDSATAVDDTGENQTINFSRPTEKWAWLKATISTDDDFPADGETQIEEALVNFSTSDLLNASGSAIFEGYGVGDDLIHSRLYQAILTIPGIVDVSSITSVLTDAEASAPAGGSYDSTNKTVAVRELVTFDTSRIALTIS